MATTTRLLSALAWLSLALVGGVAASPIALRPAEAPGHLVKRLPYISTANGTISVIDPATGAIIPQGSPSDGAGVGFDVPAILWIVFAFAVGLPLALAGLRLLRVASGAGLGILLTVCVWASLINTENATALPDLAICLIPLGAFIIAFIFGMFEHGAMAGVGFLSLMGGFSFGVRICLFRTGLLVPEHYADWLLITGFGMVGLVIFVINRRASIALASASVGTFLTALGVDLCVKQQSGMSWGLRYLFDRNAHHFQYLTNEGWYPPMATIIISAVSLGLIFPLAYAQFKLFPEELGFEPTILVQDETRPSADSQEKGSADQEQYTAENEKYTADQERFVAAMEQAAIATMPQMPMLQSRNTMMSIESGVQSTLPSAAQSRVSLGQSETSEKV